LPAQLGNILCKTQAGEAGHEPRAERHLSAALVPNRVAEDLADLLFNSAIMTVCAVLKLGFYIVVKVSDQELSHGSMMHDIKRDGQAQLIVPVDGSGEERARTR
jgi:hypothetical protein